ncbi:unnamed protein product [Linum tenue]|uniref:Peptidase A1 domain-containing protein n=1 Tax=Linum tenue TaxID=586396 RepID=A0AAV0P7K5_9ROSI|nr:unnamed protein product [Linum tenue]
MAPPANNLLISCILFCCLIAVSEAEAQPSFRPKALILPVTKDPSTLQYLTQINQRTPLVPVKLALDLGGQYLWVDCEQGYVSSSYKPAPCGSAQCSLANSKSCTIACLPSPRPGCNNNTCGLMPENTVNPVSTSSIHRDGEPSADYFIGVKSIKIDDKAIPLNKTLLSPYTVLETSIHKAVVTTFAKELSGVPRVAGVGPFELCYNSVGIGSTRVGPAVPQIDLVLQSSNVYWRIFGANSMVQVKSGVLCLGFVDGGVNPRTAIVIGGHQVEDNLLQFDLAASRLGFSSSLLSRQTTCSNFNFTSTA